MALDDRLLRLAREFAAVLTQDPVKAMRRALQDPRRRARLKALAQKLPMRDDEVYYSSGEAAKILGTCTTTIRRWARSKRVRCRYSPGGHVRISDREIRRIARVRSHGKPEREQDVQ